MLEKLFHKAALVCNTTPSVATTSASPPSPAAAVVAVHADTHEPVPSAVVLNGESTMTTTATASVSLKSSVVDASSLIGSGGGNAVVKSGWLVKMGGGSGLGKNWRRRWFTLQPPYLHYYKSPQDAHPAGTVDLGAFTHIEEDTTGMCRGQGTSRFCWKLSSRPVITPIVPSTSAESNDNNSDAAPPSPTTPRTGRGSPFSERIYYAYAETAAELDSWMVAIRPHLSRRDAASASSAGVEVELDVDEDLEEEEEEGDTVAVETTTVVVTEQVTLAGSVVGDNATAVEQTASIGMPPSTPMAAPSPIAMATTDRDETAAPAVIKDPQQPPVLDNVPTSAATKATTSPVGYKVSSLAAKMTELDAMMRRLDQGVCPKEELMVLHDMMRMCHAMLAKEQQALSVAANSSSSPVDSGR